MHLHKSTQILFWSILTYLFLVSPNIIAQTSHLNKADNLYAQFNYPLAAKKYVRLNKKGISPYYTANQIAHCYRLMGQAAKAEMWYRKAIQYTDVDNSTYFYLGQVLNFQQKQDEAVPFMNRYFQNTGYKYNYFSNNLPLLISYLKQDSLRYDIAPMPFNTPYAEMGPAISGRYLYFSSNKPTKATSRWMDVRNNQSFFKVFKYDTLARTSAQWAEKAFRSKFNNGPVCFSNDGNVTFITRNFYNKRGKTELSIVMSALKNGQWSEEVVKLPLKRDGFSIMHPALTPDAKRLYFASDRPGGLGGIDLYYTDLKAGFWSNAVNLGPTINTPGNEVFPFVTANGSLIFASDGHPGLGGLDIFMAQKEGDALTFPINMGAKLNSSSDDFALVLNTDGLSGYFTSNRQSGKGNDDIYHVTIKKMTTLVSITGEVSTPSKHPIDGVQLTILDAAGYLFNQTDTDASGKFTIYLPGNSTYSVLFRKKLYQNREIILQPSDLKSKTKEIVVEMQEK